ncbi:MAG: adenylate/guanylate cyclase domain-containing protein [Pseudomonadota bacterium]
MDETRVDRLIDWMLDGAPPSANAWSIIGGICDGLVEAGGQIDRMSLFIYTLHPNFAGRRFRWSPEEGVDMAEARPGVFTSDLYFINPLPEVIETRKSIRRKLADPDCPHDYKIVDELLEQGFTDYIVMPLPFTTDETHAVSWSTKAEGGFSEAELSALERVRRPLARLTEIYMLRLNAATLLSAYVGRNSGDRILKGAVHRGDGEEIQAVILFVDLKNFTSRSNQKPGDELVRELNAAFDSLVPEVEQRDGEVLKFLGDGFFAIFPFDGEAQQKRQTDNAVAAVHSGEQKLRENGDAGGFAIRSAVHAGRFHYGNIGGASRNDFTAIGPAVNYTARLLSAATDLGSDRVISQSAVEFADAETWVAGEQEFKGFDGRQMVFGF